jgi:hypothetical protein
MRQSQNNQPEKVLDFVMQEKVASARTQKEPFGGIAES